MLGQNGSGIRVLLADDNDALLKHVEELLAHSFDIIGTVANGELLVKQATALDPDIIVTDISMPLMNGLDAVAALRKAGSRARIVFLSVFQHRPIVDACFSAGADGFVPKARLTSDLLTALQEVMAGRKFGYNGLPR